MRWLNLAHIIAEANMTTKKTGLELLREPFPAHQISRLPKPTANQTAEVKADFKKGIRCLQCGAWHHKDVVHLDYVGHAALTDRLLDCDPTWNWEPMGVDAFGQPAFSSQGLWIRLTVCGVTRLGFGDAQDKKGPNAIKEMIVAGNSQDEIEAQAKKEGMMTMIEDGIFNAVQGNTTIEEVLRVISE